MRERREAFRDARLIVIASEGKDTERIYFKALAKEYTNPRVHVHILERSEDEQNNSSPEHVLKQLNNYKSQYELEADDELWLVIDKDVVGKVAQRSRLDGQLCRKHSTGVLHRSHPSVECFANRRASFEQMA